MDSDSDDDSLLAEIPLSRSAKRAAAKAEQEEKRKKAKRDALLKSALESADRSYHAGIALSRMQSENSEGMGDNEMQMKIEQVQAMSRQLKQTSSVMAEITDGVAEHLADSVYDHSTLRRIVQAIETDASVNFGLRPTIEFNPTRAERAESEVQFYTSEKQAVEEFKSILKKSETSKTVCKCILKTLNRMEDPVRCLDNLLQVGGKVSRLVTKNDIGTLGRLLAMWLFGVACSAHTCGALSSAATALLSHLLAQNVLSDETVGRLDETGQLLSWCDIQAWPMYSASRVGEGDYNPDEEIDPNLGGLMNLMTLWTVSLKASSSEENIVICDATLALKALFFMSIDPKVLSSKFSIGLQASIRKLMRALVRKLEQSLEPGASLSESAHCLSRGILGPLSSEIKALGATNDYCQNEALLAFPALIRGASVTDGETPSPELLSVLLCEMTAHALSTLGQFEPLDINSIAAVVPASTREVFASLPEPTRKAFATAISAVDDMLLWHSSDVASKAAQALAMSECATQAVRSGLTVIKAPCTDVQKEAIAYILARMDEQVHKFTGRLTGVAHNDFLRHIDINWRMHRQYVKDLHDRITKRQSMGLTSTPKQTKLTSYLNAADSPHSGALPPKSL